MRKLTKISAVIILVLIFFSMNVLPVLAAVPTVVTYNPDGDGTNVTLKGEITATGVVGDDDIRGFVWDATTSFADPGNVAPAASGYSDNWTEAGSFGVGEFDHLVTGLTAEAVIFYRACAHSVDGWAYGDEIMYFVLPDGNVYLEIRPQSVQSLIRASGKPTSVHIGVFNGYSLPIWNAGANQDEQLFFQVCVPDRWDGESNIIMHVNVALANAGESGNAFSVQVCWEKFTGNEDFIPLTSTTFVGVKPVYSNTQYQTYRAALVLDYDVIAGDIVEAEDIIGIRVRRIDVPVKYTELNGELLFMHVGLMFARGDLLGDPTGWIDWLISIGVLIGGVALILIGMGVIAVALTIAGFYVRRVVLMIGASFAWLVFAADAYIVSTGDMTTAAYWIFWFGIAMAIAMSLEAVITQRSAKKIKEEESAIDTLSKKYENPVDRIRREHGLPPSAARKRRVVRQREKDTGWD